MEDSGYILPGSSGSSLRLGDRSASTSVAALDRLFLFELWSKGVCYGSGSSPDPRTVADAIGAFVVGRASIDEMTRRFPWVRFGAGARAHEQGRLVDHVWHQRLAANDEVGRLLLPLFHACANRPRIRALLPFTSHEVLLFSRTTGFPFDTMDACARPVFDPSSKRSKCVERFVPNRYEVLLRSATPVQPSEKAPRSLGTGDAEWTAERLEREVPPTWGAAVDGTSEDVA
jgi:hypothetical protein